LGAACEEFATYGFAGARIERISAAAGVSGERIYSYFGNKAALFRAVLAHRLDAALDEVVLTKTGPAAAAEFAALYFDAVAADPGLARLVAWEGLEARETVALEERTRRAQASVAVLAAALPNLTADEVTELFVSVVTLVHGWHVTPQISAIVGGSAWDPGARRAAIIEHARILASRRG